MRHGVPLAGLLAVLVLGAVPASARADEAFIKSSGDRGLVQQISSRRLAGEGLDAAHARRDALLGDDLKQGDIAAKVRELITG